MENNLCNSSRDHEQTEIKCSSRKNTKEHKGRIECCMCGDIGFQERLFRCHRCHHRFQHIYCSRLYLDQLEPDYVNACDWCLDLEAKQKIQSHKRKVELQEMEGRKAKEVAVSSEIVSKSASTSAMKQPASASIHKPKKDNTKPNTLKLRVKLGGSNQNQQSSLSQDCKKCTESCRNLLGSSTHRNTRKGGLVRRYKLLSDVLCS